MRRIKKAKGSFMNPLSIISRGLKVVGGRTAMRFTGWVGAALTIGEIGWFAAKKGKILERFTHYYCEEGQVTCGKKIPDEYIEEAMRKAVPGQSSIVVKCPHCPDGQKTVDPKEWEKMKAQRKKWR
jgi:hypothetical protein